MNDSKNCLLNKQVEHFIKLSKKAKEILEELAWRYVEELSIPCNHIRVDIINMSNISIFFINRSVLGDKNVSNINIPYEALLDPFEWFKKQLEQAKKFQYEVADRVKKRKDIQKKTNNKVKEFINK